MFLRTHLYTEDFVKSRRPEAEIFFFFFFYLTREKGRQHDAHLAPRRAALEQKETSWRKKPILVSFPRSFRTSLRRGVTKKMLPGHNPSSFGIVFVIVVMLVTISTVSIWFSTFSQSFSINKEIINGLQEHTKLVDALTVRYSCFAMILSLLVCQPCLTP